MPRTAFLFIALLLAASLAGAAETLDSIARIRALSPEEAAAAVPVAIEATVTFRNPTQPVLIADDGREGIYISLPPGEGADIATGARLRIAGVTAPGGFLPIIAARTVAILGTVPIPAPRRIDPAELFSPSLDCQWVQLPGVITGIDDPAALVLVAEISGYTVKLLLPPDPRAHERAAALMQQPVTIRGVLGSVFNSQRQLTGRHFFVPSFADIIPAETPTPDTAPPLRAINELLRSDATSRTRVRIRGIVTHASGDTLYVRGKSGSILIRAASTEALTPGVNIEAEGFAAVAPFRPILRATRITVLDTGPPPEPVPLDLSGENIVPQQSELVFLDATLLALRTGPTADTILQCRTGSWFFEALLPAGTAPPDSLSPDDHLRLTGICDLTTSQVLPFGKNADGFRLHLRSPDDIAILQRAPWWTLSRLLRALAAVGALACAALAWAALLRRRVTVQTQIIGTQIQRAAVKDERQRIARELHDTIEQELAGVSLQLRNARHRLAHTPEHAATALDLAERMLRHCREEARTSIRDLRSVALEQRGLHGALHEFLTPLAAECGAILKIEVLGVPHPLSGPVEIHLLRIAHETVANAARHASPTHIHVTLTYTPHTITLETRDDGRGFDTTATAPRGHFGILGIHERAGKLHAKLHLQSTPGNGTTVRVTVPTPPGTTPS